MHMVNREFVFSDKNVHEKVSIFNKTLMNIFSNYIPNKFRKSYKKRVLQSTLQEM